MASLTINQFIDSIKSFITNVSSSKNAYYLFFGKPNAWVDANGNINDTAVPAGNSSVNSYEQSIYHDMVYGKLITSSDISYLVPRYNWTNNTVYSTYDQNDSDLYSKEFFVVTDEMNVFKCIDNNFGAASTVKPAVTSPQGVFNTADGYVWKYMYTVESNANTKFSSNNYIPVTPNANVSGNAIPGAIDFIKVSNGGIDYQAVHTGFLQSFSNSYTVQISNTASPINDRYTKSSIYLKTGFGAGQIRKIRRYDGLSRLAYVESPFDVYKVINLSNTNGDFTIGNLFTQKQDFISVLYTKGYFNIGDQVNQTDTLAQATILAANATTLRTFKFSSNSFATNLPIYDTSQSHIVKSGTVKIAANSVYVNSVANTAFTTDYSVGDFIRVGTDINYNMRRVTAVNSTVITVASAFSNSLNGVAHYSVPIAADAPSITITSASGVITNSNLSGVSLIIENPTIQGYNFIPGEKINMVGNDGLAQGSNGTVAFANSSTLILNNVQGTFLNGSNNFVQGSSSKQVAHISLVTSFPNITVSDPTGDYYSGITGYSRTPVDQTAVGNASVVSSFNIPNELTEYVISPTVEITGDGVDAIAYSVVNSAFTTTNTINQIVVLNPGTDYTFANVTIIANGLFGTGAVVTPVISPIAGHGSNTYSELGARYAGISMKIDNGTNEGYKFPLYGSYRRVGIIENPKYNDVIVDLDDFERAQFSLANRSGSGFQEFEYVVQSYSNAIGKVVFANQTFMEVKDIKGTFVANTSGDDIFGLTSQTTANVAVADINYFQLLSDVEIVSENLSGANARINQVISNNQIRLTSVDGRFEANDVIVDATTNSYANVTAIYTANGTQDVTTSFGRKFVQTARIPLQSNTGVFTDGEYVIQDVTGASGRILESTKDVDIVYSGANGSFAVGSVITDDTSGATGIITFSNSSYLRITSTNGTFSTPNHIINNLNVGADISNVYPVLVLTDVSYDKVFQSSVYPITGNTSGATGRNTVSGTIVLPDLVKNSGYVIHTENLSPVTRTNTSIERVSLVIKF